MIGLGSDLVKTDNDGVLKKVQIGAESDLFFVRTRCFVGNNDVAIGGGWNKPLGEKLRFEAMGDFYFKGDFAIRVGINYLFRKELKSRQ
jgi:hypothetical protein